MKFLLFFLLILASVPFSAAASPASSSSRDSETASSQVTEADSMEGLEMIANRMQFLTGSLAQVPAPPDMKNKTIQLPLSGENPSHLKAETKEEKAS